MRFILTESSCCRMLEQDSCLVGCCCSYCCSFLCFFAKLCFILRECTNISVSRKHTFTICLLPQLQVPLPCIRQCQTQSYLHLPGVDNGKGQGMALACNKIWSNTSAWMRSSTFDDVISCWELTQVNQHLSKSKIADKSEFGLSTWFEI